MQANDEVDVDLFVELGSSLGHDDLFSASFAESLRKAFSENLVCMRCYA